MWGGVPAGPLFRVAYGGPVEVPGDGSTVSLPSLDPVSAVGPDFARYGFALTPTGDIVFADGQRWFLSLFIECRVTSNGDGVREIGLVNVTPSPTSIRVIDTRAGIAGLAGGQQMSGSFLWGSSRFNTVRMAARQTSGVPLTFSSWTLAAFLFPVAGGT